MASDIHSIIINPVGVARIGAVGMKGNLKKMGKAVRDDARRNASAQGFSSSRTDGIDFEEGTDSLGAFVDIGYVRNHPGFVLWWHEVGTVNFAASPHLRPALKYRAI